MTLPRQGAAVELELDGVGRLSGEVDFANENFLGLRTADAMYRFFGRNVFGAPVGMTVHDFSGSGDSGRHREGLGRVPRTRSTPRAICRPGHVALADSRHT